MNEAQKIIYNQIIDQKRLSVSPLFNPGKLNKYGEEWCILPTCENLAGHDGYYCEDHHIKYYFGKTDTPQ